MQSPAHDFSQLKSQMKSVWMAGDFGKIAKFSTGVAEDFVKRTPLGPGRRVLDVACGTGNTAIPAARAGASVTGVDIATNLLEQARQRAAAENLKVEFREGDAEELPFDDHQFDVVITMFGAMFAPRPERVAAELRRVCKPGGHIAMANWTPEGFVGKTFQLTAKIVPPPPGVPAPVLWGSEQVVRERFGNGVSKLTLTRQSDAIQFPFPPKEVVGYFRQYFGPTQMTFSRLDEKGKAELAEQMEAMWTNHNESANGETKVIAEYLDVRATRA
ncbi:MAG TPA: class I SAM-dependent methyltransferase [Terriglobales bacterium]|nr:class I SAM-dependent methyltransferase [Terriglobales bacterium]